MKKVIYTCITGEYDNLFIQPAIEGYDYICFTNQSLKSSIWEIRPLPEGIDSFSTVKQQRYVKLHAHELLPEYDYSIWIDANVAVLSDPTPLIDENYVIEIPQHPDRNCIYDEKRICLMIGKDTEANMGPQMQRYRLEGFPKNYGLVQSSIMFRKHNDESCIRLMNTWWAEIEKGSHRDQLSFNYALWKNPDVTFKYLPKDTCESQIFRWYIYHGNRLKNYAPLEENSRNFNDSQQKRYLDAFRF